MFEDAGTGHNAIDTTERCYCRASCRGPGVRFAQIRYDAVVGSNVVGQRLTCSLVPDDRGTLCAGCQRIQQKLFANAGIGTGNNQPFTRKLLKCTHDSDSVTPLASS